MGVRMKRLLTIGIILLFIGSISSSTGFNLEKQSTICISNNPPYVPSNPYPIGGITDPNVTLSWDGGDPDPDDNVTYSIYFGSINPPSFIATVGPYPANKTRIHYYLGTVGIYKTYYWMIVAKDNHGASSPSPIWSFTVAYNSPPDAPTIRGETHPEVGVSYLYEFVTEDPDDDDVYYYIDWGDGNITGWIGYFKSGEEITASHMWNEKENYILRCKAKDIWDCESEWSEFYIWRSKNQQSQNIWLQRLCEKLPLLYRLVHILGWQIE